MFKSLLIYWYLSLAAFLILSIGFMLILGCLLLEDFSILLLSGRLLR